MERKTQEYMYLDKLDIGYFKEQIQIQIDDILEYDLDTKYMIKRLNTLLDQVAALRDVYFIFAGSNIEILMQPVKNAIKEVEKYCPAVRRRRPPRL